MLRPLLRLLLCLCLLVDTLGPAVAATHLAMTQAGAQAAVAGGDEATPRPADADCHTMRNAADMAPEPVAPTPDENCLERCLDLCLQHGIAVVPAAPLLADCRIAWLPALVADAQVDAVHAAPLLRPPIA
ncbi:CopL family metal-binding regulatory protein [Luteimonas sp. A611]